MREVYIAWAPCHNRYIHKMQYFTMLQLLRFATAEFHSCSVVRIPSFRPKRFHHKPFVYFKEGLKATIIRCVEFFAFDRPGVIDTTNDDERGAVPHSNVCISAPSNIPPTDNESIYWNCISRYLQRPILFRQFIVTP